MWLAGNKDIRGWYAGIFIQFLWIVFDISYEAYGLLPLSLALVVIYARNIEKWKWAQQDSREPTADEWVDEEIWGRRVTHEALALGEEEFRVANAWRYPIGTNMLHVASGEVIQVIDHESGFLRVKRNISQLNPLTLLPWERDAIVYVTGFTNG